MLAVRQHLVSEVSWYLVTGHKKQTGVPKLHLTISLADFSPPAIFKTPPQPVAMLPRASRQTPERSCAQGTWKERDPARVQPPGQAALLLTLLRPCERRSEASTSCLDNCSDKLNRAKEKVCQTWPFSKQL